MKKFVLMMAATIAPLFSSGETNPYDDLIVFVGEKTSVTEYTNAPPGGVFGRDPAFLGKYKVLEVVDGKLDTNVVEFTIYDHYGSPPFARHQYVLLYLMKDGDSYIHEKYQYDVLYKTKDGRWAGDFSDQYLHSYNTNTTIKPVPIDFAEPVIIDMSKMSEANIKKWYPESFYTITNGQAIATHGNYIPELYQLRRSGVLKARRRSWDRDNKDTK